MKKSILIAVLIIVIAVVLVPSVINLAFKFYSNDVVSAEWGAGDALIYVGSIISAVGTILLGIVAFHQNNKLQEIERSNFIANNSNFIFIKQIKVREKACVQGSLNQHYEQILLDSDFQDDDIAYNHVGFKFIFEAKQAGDPIPIMVRIKSCDFFISDEAKQNIKTVLHGTEWGNSYSRIAIHDEGIIRFEMTYIINRENKEEVLKALTQESYDVTAEFGFEIVTNKNVATKCKCRTKVESRKEEGDSIWNCKEPMIFFYSNRILKEEEINIAGEERDGEA